jgi:hypothetical protein
MIGNRETLGNIVRDEQRGGAQSVVEFANQRGDRAQRNRIKPGEGLIVKQQWRVQRDGPGQRDPPGHAAGEL